MKSGIVVESLNGDFTQMMSFFLHSVAFIKEEPEDATPDVKIEHEMKPLVVTGKCLNGTNYSMDEIDIKEEPLEADLVSELRNR